MKTLKYSIVLIALGFFWNNHDGYAQEKQRKISETFEVGPSVMLNIENKFGKVHVNTWDRNEIQAEVVIRADMRNESRSQEFIDKVEINMSQTSSMVSLSTDFGGKTNSRKGESFSIDYTISMPQSGDLDIENKFGDIYVGKLDGRITIDLKYGKMKADKLLGRSDFEIGFGGATIEEVVDAELDVKYSDVRVLKAHDVELDQQFSNVTIEGLNDINIKSRYGAVKLGPLRSIKGSAGFTDFEIEEAALLVDLKLEYVGGFEIGQLKSGFKEVRLDAQFTSMEIGLQSGISGQFEGIFKFSDLHGNSDQLDLNYVVKDMNSSEYRGKIGNGGEARISVESGYGDLRFNFDR